VRFFKQLADPPPQTTCGLSNVSNQCPPELRPLLNRVFLVMMAGAGLDSAILDPLDDDLMEAIRILETRDDSTPLGKLYLSIYDAYAAMEEFDTSSVDMSDPKLMEVAKTVNVLQNKTLYAHGYLKL
jgi:cobalamin-dependent methionine synthase I